MSDSILSVRNLTKSFGAVTASKNISIDVIKGEIHALIGPNGAGKSTLVKQIVGEIAHDAGDIELCGKSIGELGEAARVRQGLARSFQVSSLIHEFTALQNTMVACVGKRKETFSFFKSIWNNKFLIQSAIEHLENIGLVERANTIVSELSHGERRKLEIAMALCMKPKVFLLDEPMAGMGYAGSKDSVGFLAELRHQAPILLIEHDMDVVFSLADRISVLVYGEIVASGSVDEIRNNKLVKEAYLGEEL